MFRPMNMFFTNYGIFNLQNEKPAVVSISSFDEVVLDTPRPLVLCDIDETLLTFDKDYSYFVDISRHNYDTLYRQFNIPNQYINREKHREAKVNSMAKLAYEDYIYSVGPKPTDLEGFLRMVKRVKILGGEVKFLTARSESGKNFTRQNFHQIGLNYDDFEVHYTNAYPKGDHIKNNIPLDGFNKVYFIDDYDSFIESVSTTLPQIVCYKFVKQQRRSPSPNGNIPSFQNDFAI